jgi:hypothetical protein
VGAVGLCGAAFFGIIAMAASKLVTMPFHMALAFWFIRRHVPFQWSELGAALARSALVTVATALGPLAVVALSDQGFALSFSETAVAVALAGPGWLAAVLVTRHPVLLELKRALDEFAEFPFLGRPRARMVAQGPRAGEAG